MKTSRSLGLGSLLALTTGFAALGVSSVARADFLPGDLLAGVEFLQEGGPGRVYRVNEGGDLTATVPDFEMPISAPVIDICSTDDGRVLAASSTNQIVYDISSGEAVEFATIPSDASALYCGEGKIFVASFLFSAQVFDITEGGTVDEEYASGINRGLVRNVDGELWGAFFDNDFAGTGGLYKDIEEGESYTNKAPYIALTDVFATTVHKGRVFGIASFSEAVVDLSDGLPEFAHAIVPGARGITSNEGELWVSSIDGSVFNATSSLDYTGNPPFAVLPGPSLSMAVVQKCGDGEVHGREQCDDGEATELCSATCVAARCGDGVVQKGLGEECDDGNLEDGDGCDEDCDSEVPTPPEGGAPAGGSPPVGEGGAPAGGDSGDGGSAPSDDDGGDDGCSAAPSGGSASVPFLIGLAIAAAARRRKSFQR
jgi:cysteine-rich repeat protein